MITGVMPRGLTGPFAAAKATPWTLAPPSGLQSSRVHEVSLSAALSSTFGFVAVSWKGGKGIAPGAAHMGAAGASLASRGPPPAAAYSRGARQGSAPGRAK